MAKPNLRLPFLKKYRDRHGKVRFYHRPSGTALPGKPGSPEFMSAYHGAQGFDSNAPHLIVVKKTPRLRTDAVGSIDWLVTKYLDSDQWKRLSPDTQAGRHRVLESFRADHGNKPVDGLQAIHIKALMDQKGGTAH